MRHIGAHPFSGKALNRALGSVVVALLAGLAGVSRADTPPEGVSTETALPQATTPTPDIQTAAPPAAAASAPQTFPSHNTSPQAVASPGSAPLSDDAPSPQKALLPRGAVTPPGEALRSRPLSNRIVVPVFESVDGQPGAGWIGRSIQQSLLTDLAISGPLPAATSHANFGDAAATATARNLGDRYVLHGAIHLIDVDGATLARVTAELIDAQTGQTIGGIKSTGPLDDLFALEDDLSRQLHGQLQQVAAEPAHAAPGQRAPDQSASDEAVPVQVAPAPQVPYSGPVTAVAPADNPWYDTESLAPAPQSDYDRYYFYSGYQAPYYYGYPASYPIYGYGGVYTIGPICYLNYGTGWRNTGPGGAGAHGPYRNHRGSGRIDATGPRRGRSGNPIPAAPNPRDGSVHYINQLGQPTGRIFYPEPLIPGGASVGGPIPRSVPGHIFHGGNPVSPARAMHAPFMGGHVMTSGSASSAARRGR